MRQVVLGSVGNVLDFGDGPERTTVVGDDWDPPEQSGGYVVGTRGEFKVIRRSQRPREGRGFIGDGKGG